MRKMIAVMVFSLGFLIAGNVSARTKILIHGFLVNNAVDCDDYWGGMADELRTQYDVVTLGWYYKDDECDDFLPNSHISNNSTNTSVREISWEIAVYIYNNYTQYGDSVDIVAHSLGGLIVRDMLQRFGSELLVENVVTLATPHGGANVTAPSFLGCDWLNLTQCYEAAAGSRFIRNLEHNPQANGGTDWFLIGAAADFVIGANTSIAMNRGGSHKPSVWSYQYPAWHRVAIFSKNCFGPAYSVGHGTLITDQDVYACNYRWNGATWYDVTDPLEYVSMFIF